MTTIRVGKSCFAFFITVNIALAVFSRSPAAYESLKSFKILALPSVSTLQDYKSMLLCGPEEVDKRLRKERELYDGIISEAVGKQKMGDENVSIPLSEGSLIFNEVKVSMKIQRNSRDDSVAGYSMNREEMSLLTNYLIMILSKNSFL